MPTSAPFGKHKNCQLVALTVDSEQGVTYECLRAHLKKIRIDKFNKHQLQPLSWLNRIALPGNHYLWRNTLFFPSLFHISNLESNSSSKFDTHTGLSVGWDEEEYLTDTCEAISCSTWSEGKGISGRMRQGEPRGTGSSRGGTAAAQKTSEEDREPPLPSADLAPLLNEGGEDQRPQA